MKVLCLVDNSVKPLSDFWGEHGLAFLIDTGKGRLLFDTGASGTVLLHNLELAGIGTETLDSLVLSHSHPDHTGGLPGLLERRKGIPVHAHPELFLPRFSRKKGEMMPKWLPMSPDTLKTQVELHLSEKPQQILPGVWTTGEIEDRSEREGRSTHHFVRAGDQWIPDPYRDDMSLVLETEKGPFVICGCCHAGLLNTLSQVKRTFGTDPVGVTGGTHLVGAGKAELEHTIERLRELGSPALHLNHCTGQTALFALSRAFGPGLSHFPAGSELAL
jgi:7,8-dihydropterin-6-yl-methyl-4-(beta-D-ribofuranosyl)aminobenzene 5'-phosphate synthase